MVKNPRVIGLWVEPILVLELPGNARLLAAGVTRPGEIISLVDEATCRVAAEDISKVETLAQRRNAGSSEGKGFAGVAITTCVFLDFREKAKCQVLAGRLLVGPHVAWNMYIYIL